MCRLPAPRRPQPGECGTGLQPVRRIGHADAALIASTIAGRISPLGPVRQ